MSSVTPPRAAMVALFALPAALTVWLAFRAGGYFAGESAALAVILAGALGLRIAFAARPFAGIGARVAVPAAALGALAAWSLLSATWSDAPGRALVEHTRPLAYGLALLLAATVPLTEARLRILVRVVAAALGAVALAGLVTRLLPDVWEAPLSLRPGRLAYPVSYWNTMGMIAALAALLCVHLASDAREHPIARVLGAAAVPALATTVLLTFSRGAIAAGAVGLLVYLVVGRPRGVALGLLATVPASAVALVSAYGADEITSLDPTSAAAIAEGDDIAALVGLAMLAAGAIMAVPVVLGWTDRDAAGRSWALPRMSQQTRLAAALAAVAVVVGAGLAAGVPSAVGDQADRFWSGDQVPASSSDSLRARLADVGNGGRREHWRVAVEDFEAAPLRGQGAGTYQVMWAEDRPNADTVIDAHSLYIEALGELGLVGLLLIVVLVLSVAGGLLARARGPARPAVAVVAAVWIAWVLRAGIDWDWEMPALTLGVFVLAGAALARSARTVRRDGGDRPALPVRVAAVLGCLALAVLPSLVALSQARLDTAIAAIRDRECDVGIVAASDAIELLPARHEPWEALGYCELLAGRERRALQSMRAASRRDPRNWEPVYGIALAQAASGADPRPALRRALELNPREPLLKDLLEAADEGRGREGWRNVAAGSPILVPSDDAARTALGAD